MRHLFLPINYLFLYAVKQDYLQKGESVKNFKDQNEYVEFAKKYKKDTISILGVLTLLTILIPIATGFYVGVTVTYPYQKMIGAHLDNADDASTPELMKQELIIARNGMIEQGLTPETYGKFWWWEQTDDWKMNYTYAYIDGLINRTEYVIAWRNTNINASSSTSLQDVYDQMLTNLRTEYHRNGPIDWAGHPAWILKYHTWAYFIGDLITCYVLVMIILGIGLFYTRWIKNPYREDDWWKYESLQRAYRQLEEAKKNQ